MRPRRSECALWECWFEAISGKRLHRRRRLTVAMKHIKDPPPPLPSDCRRTYGSSSRSPWSKPRHAIAAGTVRRRVAAVRAGRRPPRPNHAAAGNVPTAAIPSAPKPGPRPLPHPSARRPSLTADHRRSPHPACGRTFSSGHGHFCGPPASLAPFDHHRDSHRDELAQQQFSAATLHTPRDRHRAPPSNSESAPAIH